MSNSDEQEIFTDPEILSKLKGKTLIVYWTLIKAGTAVGVRELQRILDLSSPSVASYHLEKLYSLGLVKKDAGTYQVVRKVAITELSHFVMIKLSSRTLMLPRFSFYLIFFILTFFGYWLFFFVPPLTTASFFLFILNISSIIITGYETWRQYSEKPW